ncbi:ditrans,polycis-undecaprenyl-diphosphate synthase ((2E,6E)-farnesyl-diphosphate specific) [Gammaproteobacteria bacterium]
MSVSTLESLPRHVAIIMDGNGRWAKRRHLPRFAGHHAGVGRVRDMVRVCRQRGIQVLTLFAFSSENWRRPSQEIGLLMELFITTLRGEVQELHKNNVQVRIIGARTAFPERLQEQILHTEQRTSTNTGLVLAIAANYGGRWDIADTARRLAEQATAGELDPAAITPDYFGREVCLGDLPEPDLFIRTGKEQRISNFLLWQLAYTELYFTDTLWPDFDEVAFTDALNWFSSRQRRFGRTDDQVRQEPFSETDPII